MAEVCYGTGTRLFCFPVHLLLAHRRIMQAHFQLTTGVNWLSRSMVFSDWRSRDNLASDTARSFKIGELMA